jgi:AraC family transcriptional regulator
MMTGRDPKRKYLLEEYWSRINRVMDFVESNIDRELSLAELANVAGFSRFHFHRIFRGVVGETLSGFIQRVRLEKAAGKLVQNPKKSITEIALECGFSNSSAFARAFREKYGASAGEWRSGGYREFSKPGTAGSKDGIPPGNTGQEYAVTLRYNTGNADQRWRVTMKYGDLETEVEVKDMPEQPVAYIRHIGPYKGNSEMFGDLFNRLMTWAGPRGLLRFPETKVITMYYDDPEITEDGNLRVDACITVPPETKVDGEVGKTTIPAGRYAVARFEIDPDRYQDAWNAVFSGWLPESGYQPADGPCYEMYPGDMNDYSKGQHLVDICVPVKPL